MTSVPFSSTSSTRSGIRRACALVLAAAAAGVWSLASAGPASADFKLCNGTSSRIGVALGYEEAGGWATEGWWNIPARGCETLLRGTPPSTFIYVYAVDYDRGGEWTGTNFMCTGDKSFRIRGSDNCEKQGHRRTGFMEVDTRGSKDWTVQFNDPEQ